MNPPVRPSDYKKFEYMQYIRETIRRRATLTINGQVLSFKDLPGDFSDKENHN